MWGYLIGAGIVAFCIGYAIDLYREVREEQRTDEMFDRHAADEEPLPPEESRADVIGEW